jgi:hypothetical protein
MFSGVGKFRSSQRLPEGFDSGGIFSFIIERLASRYPIAPTFSCSIGFRAMDRFAQSV